MSSEVASAFVQRSMCRGAFGAKNEHTCLRRDVRVDSRCQFACFITAKDKKEFPAELTRVP